MEMKKRASSSTCPTTGATNSNIMATTIREEIEELKRELRTRRQVYPGWQATGKITSKEAEHRKACLESTIERLEALDCQQSGAQAVMLDNG